MPSLRDKSTAFERCLNGLVNDRVLVSFPPTVDVIDGFTSTTPTRWSIGNLCHQSSPEHAWVRVPRDNFFERRLVPWSRVAFLSPAQPQVSHRVVYLKNPRQQGRLTHTYELVSPLSTAMTGKREAATPLAPLVGVVHQEFSIQGGGQTLHLPIDSLATIIGHPVLLAMLLQGDNSQMEETVLEPSAKPVRSRFDLMDEDLDDD